MQYHTINCDINRIFVYIIFIYNLTLYVMPPHKGLTYLLTYLLKDHTGNKGLLIVMSSLVLGAWS